MTRRELLVGGVGMMPLGAFGAAAAPSQTVVWRAGEDGYHTYRIPAVVLTKKRTLLAFCEGRRSGRGDSGDIDLLVKRSRDGGRTWSRQTVVADFGGDTIGNPVPVVERRTGRILLPLTRNPGAITEKQIRAHEPGATRTVWFTSSGDDGVNWETPREITSTTKASDWSWYATGPCNGIQTRSGRILIPCDHNRGEKAERWSHVIYSDDGGRSWKLGGSAGPHCNESTMVELRDGSLLLNMRSYHGRNRRAVSRSADGGLTWTEPVLDEALVEPVCQGSLIRYRKDLLLFSNPASAKRERMTVKLSRDEGRTWVSEKVLHEGPAAYSNLVELPQGVPAVLYERGRQGPYEEIVFETFAMPLQ